jgi:molybdopterin-guanine dinucleotide biosynthesis protein A
MSINIKEIAGVILAGGLSTRMGGGNKCLLKIGKKTMLDYVIARASRQVSKLSINVNGKNSAFESYNLPLIQDSVKGYVGPLGGILSGIEWAKKNFKEIKFVASFASDTPLFPENLIQRMGEMIQKNNANIAYAKSGTRTHPVFGLWSVDLMEDLKSALINDGVRKIDSWAKNYSLIEVPFTINDIDPFINVNKPEDLIKINKIFKENNIYQ